MAWETGARTGTVEVWESWQAVLESHLEEMLVQLVSVTYIRSGKDKSMNSRS